MKTFKYFNEVAQDALNPLFPYGGSSYGPGMGQYEPIADLNADAKKEVKKSDLDQIERYADRIFAAVGIDVEFTRHFLDRVNDARNVKQITPSELTRLFKQSFKKYGKKISKLGDDAQAVINDMKTDINMPFVLNKTRGGELELVAKTVMRKKNFSTSNTKLSFESYSKIDDLVEDFGVVANQAKLSELIFRGSHKFKDAKEVDNMYIPMSSAMFKRVFPKQVRVRTFHVTSPDGFERLYDIQNSTKSISTFANMSSRNISGGIAEGSGVVAEIDGNALVSSSQDLFSVPIKDGRRLISYGWLRGTWGERNLTKMDKDMTVLLKALIKKYAPERAKKRTSPYFTDFEVWKSVRASYEWHKNEPDKKVQKAAGKKMQKIIKDYLDGVEKVLKKNATQVQHILTNYLKTRRTEDNWDEIIVDDFNVLKVFLIEDAEDTAIFKKDKFDPEKYKKMLEGTKLPVEITDSIAMERYVLGVAEKEAKLMKEERNYIQEIKFFTDDAIEQITIPNPPKNDMVEILKLKKIMNARTPEDEQSVKNHDEVPFYAIKKYCQENGLEFHKDEFNDLIKQSIPIILHFKDKFNRKRPKEIDGSIDTLNSKTTNTRSYPSGHSAQSMLVAKYVIGKFPKHEKGLIEAAQEGGIGRVLAGFHYLSDHVAGKLLGEKMYLIMNKDDYNA